MPWKDRVRAILEMWYPGQEGGWATANVLMGRASPSGKLPVTFPVRLEDAPARAADHPERLGPAASPGFSGTDPSAPTITFSEGIAVGYRWYDQQNIEPLFPFGHGLSYTRFEYSDLVVETSDSGLDVTFTLWNAGRAAGAEVAQIYLGPAEGAPVHMAMKSLAAFRRVEIGAGRSRRITLHVQARALEYWSVDRHTWVLRARRSSGVRRFLFARHPSAGEDPSSHDSTARSNSSTNPYARRRSRGCGWTPPHAP